MYIQTDNRINLIHLFCSHRDETLSFKLIKLYYFNVFTGSLGKIIKIRTTVRICCLLDHR